MEEIIIDKQKYFRLFDDGCEYFLEYKADELFDDITKLNEAYKRKEKECEELKEKLKTLDDSVITYELTESDFKKYNKLKQALQEIKDLCEFNSCSYDNGIEYVFVDDVLQIISEVEK